MLEVPEIPQEASSLIATPPALTELVAAMADAPTLAIDTEFIRETTYHPQLCLLQVATDSLAACVDCVADMPLAPLFDDLAGGSHTWIIHSARQDIEVIEHCGNVRPARLIDTQIAAALAGHAPQISLQELLATILDVHLDKAFTRTNWTARPLPAGALQYAVDDVLYLLPLWRELESTLARLGRADWLVEECARLLQQTTAPDLGTIWKRLKGVQALDLETQAAAMALTGWRETTARELDRPRRWIMQDELLLRLAVHRPTTTSALAAIATMPHRLVGRSGKDIVAAIDARNEPRLVESVQLALGPPRPDKQAFKALQAKIRAHAATLGIEPEVLATRRDIEALLADTSPTHLTSGWRAGELAGLV